MTRLVVGPFDRMDGDLELRLDVAAGKVTEAQVSVPLYRGFEQILVGRHPTDALAVVPRVCGGCSLAHSAAAAAALAGLSGVGTPPNGRLATSILLAAETLAAHIAHFYLFFMPDFAGRCYAGQIWHGEAVRRFAAMTGEATTRASRARARFLHVMGILAGKWPHSLTVQPGGTTKAVDAGECVRLLAIVAELRGFLEDHLFADDLERVAGLHTADALATWRDAAPAHLGDARFFLQLADDLHLVSLGRGSDRFLSYGVPEGEGYLMQPGLWHGGPAALDIDGIAEDLAGSWMAGRTEPPRRGVTRPDADRTAGYTWCKSPRLNGGVAEAGALARQVVDGQPLMRDLVAAGGGNVRDRVLARLVEAARLVLALDVWIRRLRPREPFCDHAALPADGHAVGLVESARGALGHWLAIRGGRIVNYQIVSPATWNLSPRDAGGVPGPLEQALVGTPVRAGETMPIAVRHVVRSFDPCPACASH